MKDSVIYDADADTNDSDTTTVVQIEEETRRKTSDLVDDWLSGKNRSVESRNEILDAISSDECLAALLPLLRANEGGGYSAWFKAGAGFAGAFYIALRRSIQFDIENPR
jgi:hypothetical protein